MKISQQGYLLQRKRLNPDIFSTMNDEYLIDFYKSGEAKLWNGCLLPTMDELQSPGYSLSITAASVNFENI